MSERQTTGWLWIRERAAVRSPAGLRWVGLSVLSVSVGVGCALAAAALMPRSVPSLAGTWSRLASAVLGHSEPQSSVRSRGAPPAAPVAAAQSEGPLWFGDRVKIVFLESVGVSLGTPAEGDGAAVTVFPRLDISGEFSVDEGGGVAVPKLGRIGAAGRTAAALQSDLSRAFQAAFGRRADVHVALLDRQPVYVAGAVRAPGTYRYVPGMIALQALAGAGGGEGTAADASKAIETIRETARLHMTEDRFDRLLVRRAMLVAERDGAETVPRPAGFAASRDEAWLAPVLSSASASLAASRRARAQQLTLAARQLAAARAELEAQTLRAEQIKDLISKKQAKLHELEAVAARGNVPQYRLSDANVEIAELVAREEDLRVALIQAEGRLATAEGTAASVDRDFTATLAKEIAATQQELDENAQAIAATKAVIEVLHGGAAAALGGRPAIRVTRRDAEGFIVIAATETTPLLPGDVVQVVSEGSAAPAAARSASRSPLQP